MTGEELARSAARPAPRAGMLATLLEIGQTLASPVELRTALERVLGTLERDAGVRRAAVLMLDSGSEEIRVAVSVGLAAEAHRVRCRLGQGIAGRVVESGRPVAMAVPSREPLFPRGAGEESALEGSFYCVPIAAERRPLGALAIEVRQDDQADGGDGGRFFALIATMISQALRIHRRLEEELDGSADEIGMVGVARKRQGLGSIIGVSPQMREACERIARIAPTGATVLIRGEPGTGKELVARAIHSHSARAKKAFVKVSVGAVPDRMIESEVFGHEKGAFAGATSSKRGSLELACGGTLFLDEVGELSGSAQTRFLRLLREGRFARLGGTETLSADVRILAASTTDLEAAVAAQEFREDLHRRLSASAVFLPPLRERGSDVLLLAEHFFARYSRAHGKRIRRISTAAMDMLASHPWPGNVRELENTIERAVLSCESSVLHGHHLPPALQVAKAPETSTRASLSEAVQQYEKDLILDALKSARGNRMHAARLLDTTERVIGYKIHKYGIEPQRFRAPGLASR